MRNTAAIGAVRALIFEVSRSVGIVSAIDRTINGVGDASGSTGALVSQVVSGSPADSAGIKAGDVITALDGKAIASANDLTASLSAHAPGDKVTLTVTRTGSTKSIDVTLGSRPS